MEESYVIVKVLYQNSKEVLLLNGQCEVLEFTDKQVADDMAELFQKNSDSGHKYYARKV